MSRCIHCPRLEEAESLRGALRESRAEIVTLRASLTAARAIAQEAVDECITGGGADVIAAEILAALGVGDTEPNPR